MNSKRIGNIGEAKVPCLGVRTSASFFGPLACCGLYSRQGHFTAAMPQGGKSIAHSGRREAPTKLLAI